MSYLPEFIRIKKTFVAKTQKWTYSPAFVIVAITKGIGSLMTRSGDYLCLYNPETGLWEPDETVGISLIDKWFRAAVLEQIGPELAEDKEHCPEILRIADTENGLIDKFHKFVQRQIRDRYRPLNQKIIFSNQEAKKEDYCTKKAPYPLIPCPTPYYDKMIEHWYSPEDQQMFEWGIGSIIAGEQSKIQKIFVFYGEPGAGKSTVISTIFAKYVFGGSDYPFARSFKVDLLTNRDAFGTDFLTSDPLYAFDDEADLSRIETNTVLNVISAHEDTRVNPKYGKPFTVKPNCLMFCGSNYPVQLSPDSGLNRRLMDIRPTGEKLSPEEYDECLEHIPFEVSGIAYKCYTVYKKLGKSYYNKHVAENMLTMTNPFHNFVKDKYFVLKDGISLPAAYEEYKAYCEECGYTRMVRHKFRDLLKNYFVTFQEKKEDENGNVISDVSWFEGFKYEKIGMKKVEPEPVKAEEKKDLGWLKFDGVESHFDKKFAACPAQYAVYDKERDTWKPEKAWDNCKTILKDLDTTKMHYVLLPKEIIFADFDIKGEDGKKDLEKNTAAANKFPPTYAELSKSGGGIHLTYIYTGGDPDELSRVFDDNIEIKVSKGKSACRRVLTKFNSLPIAEISSGLPFKEGGAKMVDQYAFENEKKLRIQLIKCLKKEYEPHSTICSCQFMDKLLKEAYTSGKEYDVSDLYGNAVDFAGKSTHNAQTCLNLVDNMFWKSKKNTTEIEEPENYETKEYKEAPIVFYDVESYPEDKEKNMPALFVVCWKFQGKDKPVVKMINPSPKEVKDLFKFRLIGFNNRDYDNHMIYGRAMGLTEAELNRRSQQMINGKSDDEKRNAKFMKAYNISYADVHDFATNKQSLKKWEIELKEDHMEMSIPWDQAAPKERWADIAEYCANDVRATEAVFNACKGDFDARKALAKLSGLTVNDPNRKHIYKIIVGDEKEPQLVYTDLATGEQTYGR